IRRPELTPASLSEDRDRYQTVYAEHIGSVAAPTAGLHLTSETFHKLRTRNVETASVTLHVGLGTFLPVKCEEVEEHRMHQEEFFIPRLTLERIFTALRGRRPIVCVGTTSFRCLESLAPYARDQDRLLSEYADRWLTTD